MKPRTNPRILTINGGSSSIKFARHQVDAALEQRLLPEGCGALWWLLEMTVLPFVHGLECHWRAGHNVTKGAL